MAAKNRKKPSTLSTGVYHLTRTGVLGWALLFVIATMLLFVMGVLVGRGRIAYPLGKDDLTRTLSEKREIAQAADAKKINQLMKDGGGLKPFDFHEGVKQTKTKIKPLVETPTKPAQKPTPAVSKQAEKAPAKKTPIKKTKKAKTYTIQVASVREVQAARDLVDTLKEMGFDQAYRITGKIQGRGTWYRVRIGHYESQRDVKKTLDRLKRHKLDGFVILE